MCGVAKGRWNSEAQMCPGTHVVAAGREQHADDLLIAVDDKVATHFLSWKRREEKREEKE